MHRIITTAAVAGIMTFFAGRPLEAQGGPPMSQPRPATPAVQTRNSVANNLSAWARGR